MSVNLDHISFHNGAWQTSSQVVEPIPPSGQQMEKPSGDLVKEREKLECLIKDKRILIGSTTNPSPTLLVELQMMISGFCQLSEQIEEPLRKISEDLVRLSKRT